MLGISAIFSPVYFPFLPIILALTLKPFNFATFKFKLLDLMLKVN